VTLTLAIIASLFGPVLMKGLMHWCYEVSSMHNLDCNIQTRINIYLWRYSLRRRHCNIMRTCFHICLSRCEVCKKRFARHSHLTKHLIVHSGDWPISWKLRKKRFAHRFVLNTHLRMHGREWLFSCKLCEKMFTQCCHLVRHLGVHRGEWPFLCEECKETFVQRSQPKEASEIIQSKMKFSIYCR
jgi:hypothetical protein